MKSVGTVFRLALIPFALMPGLSQIPSPESHLGRPVGTDFKLADWKQVSSYFDKLSESHPRVRVEKVGKTTEGRDFRIAVISSEANLARLEEIKSMARQLADPRGLGNAEKRALLRDGRLILFISNNMHSTEIAAAEMSMQLAYNLATSTAEPWASARDQLVVVMTPSTNPDGLDRVVHWYREIQGTAYENARLPELYQWYAGHDNNRDWFMASLKETRIVTRLLYSEWFPQVYWDVHQMGGSRERMFFPPFRDPLNPNLDPALITGINAIGSRVMLDLTRKGFQGVSSGVSYDMWWNGGNRSVPVRHNIMGFLSEAASANLASPVYLAPRDVQSPRGLLEGNIPSNKMPDPWTGGWWHVGDIIRYELAIAESLFGTLARERESWLELSLQAAERAVASNKEAPYAWLIPADNEDLGAVQRLMDALILGGVEVAVAKETFSAGGLDYPAATLVIFRNQPYGTFVKDLFEVQRFPDGARPYDVAGWTLPLLMGVRRVAVAQPFEVATDSVADAFQSTAGFSKPDHGTYPWFHLPGGDSRSLGAAIALLNGGVPVYFDGNGDSKRPGAWVVAKENQGKAADILTENGIQLSRPKGSSQSKPASAKGLIALGKMPRVGLYAPWTSNMDEGWTRWVFDHFEMTYSRLRNEHLRAGSLKDRFDVIVLPSVRAETLHEGRSQGSVFPRYVGGLDPEGSMALFDFVKSGGTLISVERSNDYVNEIFDLGLENAAAFTRGDEGFACPGSVLRTVPLHPSPWTAGLNPSHPIFFSYSNAWRVKPVDKKKKEMEKNTGKATLSVEHLLVYPPSRPLLSGWIRKPQAIAEAGAWLRIPMGRGQIHLFGFRPSYRSWTHASFNLLLRACLLPSEGGN